VQTFTVIFLSGIDGAVIYQKYSVPFGTLLYTLLPAPPVRPGYVFSGWYESTAKLSYENLSGMTVERDLVFTADYALASLSYTITVTGATGTGVYAQGTKITVWLLIPPDKTFEDFTVTGTSLSFIVKNPDGSYSFTVNGSDIALIANYIDLNGYEITFDADGGSPVPDVQTVFENGLVKCVENPAKEGYIFLGWFSAGSNTAWNFATDIVNDDIALTAHWVHAGNSAGDIFNSSWWWIWLLGGFALGLIVTLVITSRKKADSK